MRMNNCIAAGLAGITLAAVPASAFVLLSPPRKWFQGAGGDTPVQILIYDQGEDSIADGDNGVTAIGDAAEAWDPEAGANLVDWGTIGQNLIGRDGLNTVSFEDPARIVRRAIAVTLVGWYDGGQSQTTNNIDFARIEEADISFSNKLDFTTAAIGSCNREYDVAAVMTHEVGHFLGLDHSANGAALMAPSISECVFKPLNQDDVDGINTIYNDGYGGGTGGPCTATEYNLTQHSCSAPSRGKNCLEITISAVDDCGNPASGATVTVQLSGAEAGDVLTGSAAMSGAGTITFALACKDAASQTYTSEVLSISGSTGWSPSDPDNTAPTSITCVTR